MWNPNNIMQLYAIRNFGERFHKCYKSISCNLPAGGSAVDTPGRVLLELAVAAAFCLSSVQSKV